jgi:hypothetical protein
LTVYNILGQEVQTVFNGDAAAGELYTVIFDAGKLSSGLYLYELLTRTHRTVKPMFLMK